MKLSDGTEIDIETDDLISTSMMRELGWGRLVEQELPTFLEHLNSPPCFCWGWCYSIFNICVVLCRSLFYLLFLVIALPVLLFTASDYPFDKRFFHWNGPPARCCVAHWNICCKLFFCVQESWNSPIPRPFVTPHPCDFDPSNTTEW